MDSYKELKEEMDYLQEQIEKIHLEKEKLLEPLYDMVSEYPDYLGNILPKNVNATQQKTLNLRLIIFEEEAKTLPIEDIKKSEILNLIENIQNEINERYEKLKNINERISILSPEYEQRRNYILEKIEKIRPLEEEIKKLEEQIDLHSEYLYKIKLSKKTEDIFISIIEEYQAQIDEKRFIIRKIVGDETVAEDIKILSGLEVEPEHKYSEESTEESNIKTDTKDNDDSVSQNSETLKNIFENKLKDFYSYTYVPEETPEEDNNDNELSMQIEDKKEELSEEQKETLKALKNIFEDKLRDFNSNTNVHTMEIQQSEGQFEEDLYVEDVYNNFNLQEGIEEEKGLRIKLGLSNLSSRISKLLPKKENLILKKSHKLYDKLQIIKENYFDDLEERERKTINSVLLKLKLIMDKTNEDFDLIQLQELNNQLEKYIDDLYVKYELIESSSKRIR